MLAANCFKTKRTSSWSSPGDLLTAVSTKVLTLKINACVAFTLANVGSERLMTAVFESKSLNNLITGIIVNKDLAPGINNLSKFSTFFPKLSEFQFGIGIFNLKSFKS